jgi:dnd system-associated protein 4
MERRIAPAKANESILDRLTEVRGSDPAIFETKQKALMFAAGIGYHRGNRTPLKARGQGIRFDIFERDMDDAFIAALALAEANDLNVLRTERDDERAVMFEEYANAGLLEINRACFSQEGDPIANLIRLTREAQAGEDSEVPGIDADVLRNLL